MKSISFVATVFAITFWGACFWLSSAPAYAQKIPALAEVSAGLSIDTQASLNQRRQELDAEYYRFQKAADAFNAKPAEQQTDGEYEALARWKSRYIAKVNAFNRDVTSFASAQKEITKPPAATVFPVGIAARGEFSIALADGGKLTDPLAKAAHIYTGSQVTTGPNGHIQFILPDETVFTIGPNSDIVIDDFVYDTATTSTLRKIAVSVTKGVFRFVTGKVARENPAGMKVTLPVGTIGDRGTEAEIEVALDGSGYVKLFSGELEITPKKTGVKFVVNAKHMVTFKADGTFSPSEPINDDSGTGEEQMRAP